MNLIKFFSIFIFLGFIACNKSKEGCLDILSANFDPTADIECENCCVFPTFNIQLKHVFNDKEIDNFKDTFKNNLASSFKIVEQKFYFSDIEIFAKTISLPFITRSTYLFNNGTSDLLFDNIGLIQNVSKLIPINTIRTTFNPDSLHMQLGVNQKYNSVNIEKLPNQSSLSINNGMYSPQVKEYITYYLKVAIGKELKDTVTFNINEDYSLQKSYSTAKVTNGQSINFNLIADYNALSKDIDFENSKEIIETKLKLNLKNFIK